MPAWHDPLSVSCGAGASPRPLRYGGQALDLWRGCLAAPPPAPGARLAEPPVAWEGPGGGGTFERRPCVRAVPPPRPPPAASAAAAAGAPTAPSAGGKSRPAAPNAPGATPGAAPAAAATAAAPPAARPTATPLANRSLAAGSRSLALRAGRQGSPGVPRRDREVPRAPAARGVARLAPSCSAKVAESSRCCLSPPKVSCVAKGRHGGFGSCVSGAAHAALPSGRLCTRCCCFIAS